MESSISVFIRTYINVAQVYINNTRILNERFQNKVILITDTLWAEHTFTCWNESLVGVLTSILGSAFVILSRCCLYLFCSHCPVNRSCLFDCRKHLVLVPMSIFFISKIHTKKLNIFFISKNVFSVKITLFAKVKAKS